MDLLGILFVDFCFSASVTNKMFYFANETLQCACITLFAKSFEESFEDCPTAFVEGIEEFYF